MQLKLLSSLNPRRNQFYYFFAVTLVLEVSLLYLIATRVGFYTISQSGDGPEYIDFSLNLLSGRYPYIHFPMYPVFIRLTSFLVPIFVAPIVVSAVAHVLTAPVYWKTCLRDAYASSHILFLLFISVFPPTILIYSLLPVADALAFLFVTLTYYFLITEHERAMLLCSMLAVATHYIALLIIPGIIYYFIRKTNHWHVLKVLVTALPFIAFSLYQYAVQGDILFYFHVRQSYDLGATLATGAFSYPFATVVFVARNYNLFSLLLLLSVYVLYIAGFALCLKQREIQNVMFSIPFLVFIIMMNPKGFFFVPRYATYAFPLLLVFQKLEKRKFVIAILLILTVASVGYAFFRALSL